MRVQVYVGKVPHDIECEPSWFFGQIKEQIFMITKVGGSSSMRAFRLPHTEVSVFVYGNRAI